jgi:hypothetical protein
MLVLFKRKIIAISYGIYVTAFAFNKLDSPIPSGQILWSVGKWLNHLPLFVQKYVDRMHFSNYR